LLYAAFDGERYQWKQGPADAQYAGVSFTDNSNTWSLGAAPSCQKCGAAEHGTHVAGIIASSGTLAYGEQVFGVAPATTILPINIFSKIDDPDICNGIKNTPCTISYAADQLNAESWLAGQSFTNLPQAPKIKVINMSIGGFGGCSRIAQENFIRLLNQKMSIIVAAGNSNIDAAQTYPAGCPQVLSIAATGPSGEKAWYSNWGNSIAMAAPGGNSLNPILGQPNNQIYSTIAHAYKFSQGTSMAAPMVSGVVALMYAITPTLTQQKVLQIISQPKNTTPFPKEEVLPTGLSSCVGSELNPRNCGAGIINAAKIITYMLKQSG
jgi:serine protease